ncbi:hypothetical protein KJ695_03155 [Patescibacteria group bacterium]|nr:hypothetical protein [Patescibacteria group bacterium]MBU4056879.1 hypothetical protein [Patescibacteria group bacterium]MBU4368605.1 hypothetical protein [Patescibacteria group bacterium]
MQNKYFGAVSAKLRVFYGYKYSRIAVWTLFSFIAFYDLYIVMNQIYAAKKEVFVYGETNTRPLTVNIRKDIINKIDKRIEAREKILGEDLSKSYKNPFLPYSSKQPPVP